MYLFGLGAMNGVLTEAEAFSLLRPLLPPGTFFEITDQQLSAAISALYTKNLVIAKTNVKVPDQAGLAASVEAALKAAIPLPTLGAYRKDIPAAVNTLAAQGFKLIQASAVSAPQRAPAQAIPESATLTQSQFNDFAAAGLDMVRRAAIGVPTRSMTAEAQEIKRTAAQTSLAPSTTAPAPAPESSLFDVIGGLITGATVARTRYVQQKQQARDVRRSAAQQRYDELQAQLQEQQTGAGPSPVIKYGAIGLGVLALGVIAVLAIRKARK
jgi:hypothetical protein